MRKRFADMGERYEIRYRNYKGEDVVYGRTDSTVIAQRFLRVISGDPCRENQRIVDRQLPLFISDAEVPAPSP